MSPTMRLDLSGLRTQNGKSDSKELESDDPIAVYLANSINVRVSEDQLKLDGQPLCRTSLLPLYPAQLTRTGRPAVPVVVKCYSKSQDDVAAFMREVQLLWTLHHPNIIKVCAWTVTAKTLMLAVEYATVSLQELLLSSAKGRRLSSASKLTIAAQVADALRYLHKRSICHGKLCPAHIMLGAADGFSKLTSFSHCAMQLDDGTLGSMPPATAASGINQTSESVIEGMNDDASKFGELLTELFSISDAPQITGSLRAAKEALARPVISNTAAKGNNDTLEGLRARDNLRSDSLRSRVSSIPPIVETLNKATQQRWIPLHVKRIAARCVDADTSKRLKMPELLKALTSIPEQVESDIQALSASLRSGVQAELQQTLRQLHGYLLDGWCDPCIPLDPLLTPSIDALPFTPRTARNVGPPGQYSAQPGTPFAARNCMWGRIMELVLSLACSSPAVPVVQACVSLLLCYTQACHQHCKALTHKGGLQALLLLLEAHSNGVVRATCLQTTIVVMQAWIQSGMPVKNGGRHEHQLTGDPLFQNSNGVMRSTGTYSGELGPCHIGSDTLKLQPSGSEFLASSGSSRSMVHSGSLSQQGSAGSGQLPPGRVHSSGLAADCARSSMGLDSIVGEDGGVMLPAVSGECGENGGAHGTWPASPIQVLLSNLHWLVPMMQDLDAKVRNNACLLVRLLAASDDRTRAALVQYGAVTYLDALLQDPPADQIHLNATAALLLLSGSNAILGAISEAKATVPTLIKLLKPAVDKEVAAQAAAVLAALARHGMGPAITAYEPALTTVLQLVKQPLGSVDASILACLAEMLCGVASNSAQGKASLVKAGLVPPLVVLLQHPNMYVVKQVAAGLVRLAYDPPEAGQLNPDSSSPQAGGQYKPGQDIVDAGAVLACLYCPQHRSLVSIDDAATTLAHVIISNPSTTPPILPVVINRLTYLGEIQSRAPTASWTSIISPAVPPLLSQLKTALSQTSALAGPLCCCVQCLVADNGLKGLIVGSPGIVGLLGAKLHAMVKDLEKKVAVGGLVQREGSGRLTPSASPRPSPRPSPRDPPGGVWSEEDIAFNVVCCLWSLAWHSPKVQLELLDAGTHLDVLALMRMARGRNVLITACVFYLGCFIVERSSRVRLKVSSVEEALAGLPFRQAHPKTAQLAKALVQAVKEGDNKAALDLMFVPLPNVVQEWMLADNLLVHEGCRCYG